LEKKKALEILDALIGKISPMSERATITLSGEFLKWKRDVTIAISNIFPSNRAYSQDFDEIQFWATNARWDETERKLQAFRGGLERADALLRSMREEVSLYWSEKGTPESPGGVAEGVVESHAPEPSKADSKTVFVIHGRNEALRKSMFDFLRSIGLKPLEWSQAVSATGKGSPWRVENRRGIID
jgi:hypothetical protein